jgi:hypothetical protein
VVVGDDLQTDRNVKSKELIDSAEEYLQGLIPIVDPLPWTGEPGPRHLVGTRWGFDDLWSRVIAKDKLVRKEGGKPAYKKLVREAYRGNKYVFFPSRFSKESLMRMKKTEQIDDYFFSCQWLNNPRPAGTEVFKWDCIGFFDPDAINFTGYDLQRRGEEKGLVVQNGEVRPLPQMMNYFVTVDPSIGEKADSAYTAIVVCGVDSAWNMYIWEVLRKQIGLEEGPSGQDPVSKIVEMLFEVYNTYHPFRIGVESVAWQKSIVWGFDKAARERGQWFYVDQLQTDTQISKDMRIRGFEPFVTGRKLHLRVRENTNLTAKSEDLYHALPSGDDPGGSIDVLADEVIRFPLGATKDCIDATAYFPQVIFPAGEPPKPKRDPKSFGVFLDRLRERKRPGLLRAGR